HLGHSRVLSTRSPRALCCSFLDQMLRHADDAVDFSGETPVVTDGPYGETKEFSTAPSRSRWLMGRSLRCPSWTNWSRRTAWRGRTCSQACPANSSPGWGAQLRHELSLSSQRGYVRTPGSGQYWSERPPP